MVANEGRPEWQRAVKTGRDPETTSSAHQHGQLRRRGSLYCVWRFVGVGHDNGSDRPARRFARTIPAGRPSSTLRRSFLRSPPSRCARTRPSPPSRPLQTRQPLVLDDFYTNHWRWIWHHGLMEKDLKKRGKPRAPTTFDPILPA